MGIVKILGIFAPWHGGYDDEASGAGCHGNIDSGVNNIYPPRSSLESVTSFVILGHQAINHFPCL